MVERVYGVERTVGLERDGMRYAHESRLDLAEQAYHIVDRVVPPAERKRLFVQIESSDGSTIRGNPDEIQATVSRDNLSATRFRVSLSAGSGRLLTIDEDARFESLFIRATSQNETEARGWAESVAVRLEAWLSHSRRQMSEAKEANRPATPEPTTAAKLSPAATPSSSTSTAPNGQPSSRSVERTSTGSYEPRRVGWFERTWRDHAAALVVTIVGTVLAALILVYFLGIK